MFGLTDPHIPADEIAARALATVLRQVAAFNEHDLDAFVDTYADDAVVTGITPAPISGRLSLREFYQDRFGDAQLHCTVRASVVFGDFWVVLHEFVESSRGSGETIGTFEVMSDRITRAVMLKAST